MDFRYKISEYPDLQDTLENIEAAREPEDKEIIAIRTDDSQGPAIIANKAGWIYLAKICIEMAYLSEKDPTFHLHRNAEFMWSDDTSNDAISFFLADSETEKEVIQKRSSRT